MRTSMAFTETGSYYTRRGAAAAAASSRQAPDWAFYMEGKRWSEGNRGLVTNENVELPVLDGFRMLERLGDQRVEAHADGVGVLAGDRAAIVYHHVDTWWVEGTAAVTLRCEGAGRA